MELEKAVHQLAEIHTQMSKTEFYRGFKAVPVALTGVSSFIAAGLQPLWITSQQPMSFINYWGTLALFNVIFMSAILTYEYLFRENSLERRKTKAVLMQFFPALAAGALLTFVATEIKGEFLWYMPALWTLVFALGVFACRPYYPSRIFWIGSYYLIASAVLFKLGFHQTSTSPWGMGLTFGFGQILVASMLYWDLERHGR